MSERKKNFIAAEERLLAEVQFALQWLIRAKNVSQTELADRLGVSTARVSQYFSEDASINVRTLARIFTALEEKPEISSKGLDAIKTEWSRRNETLTVGEILAEDKAILEKDEGREFVRETRADVPVPGLSEHVEKRRVYMRESSVKDTGRYGAERSRVSEAA